MLRILILGKNSYIGNHLKRHLEHFPDKYQLTTLSQRDDQWQSISFSVFDSIVDCVGIAHRKETTDNANEYYEINSELAFQTAKKAKEASVKQFVFISSMSVYGLDEGVITRETTPNPKTNYGKSKLEAEQKIATLQDEGFNIAIIRPPMVYGEGCKGNYQSLVKLAEILPFCPTYCNQRSMISIENLCSFIRDLIDTGKSGLFLPQDPEYHSTCDMIYDIAKKKGRNIKKTRLANIVPAWLKKYTYKGRKAFGNLIYER